MVWASLVGRREKGDDGGGVDRRIMFFTTFSGKNKKCKNIFDFYYLKKESVVLTSLMGVLSAAVVLASSLVAIDLLMAHVALVEFGIRMTDE